MAFTEITSDEVKRIVEVLEMFKKHGYDYAFAPTQWYGEEAAHANSEVANNSSFSRTENNSQEENQ